MTLEKHIEQLAFRESMMKWAQEEQTGPVDFQTMVDDLQRQAEENRARAETARVLKNFWNYDLGPQLYQTTEPLFEKLDVQNPFPM